jgi:hypothetical protein
VVLLQVLVEVVRAQHLRDLHQLVAIAISHEEGFLLEDLDQELPTIEANMAPVDQMSSE